MSQDSGVFKATGTGILSKLNDHDWARMQECGEVRTFDVGETILIEGDASDTLFLVRDGEVRVERDIGGSMVELARVGAGGIFGEMSMLEKSAASASIVTTEPVEIVRLNNATIEALIDEDEGFGLRFYQSLAVSLSSKLRATNEVVRDVTIQFQEMDTMGGKPKIDTPMAEAMDLTPALGNLMAFVKEATLESSAGGVKCTEQEKQKYVSLRERMNKELGELDQAVANNQFLPVPAY